MNNFLVTVSCNVYDFLKNMRNADEESHGTILADVGVSGIVAITTVLEKEEVEKVDGADKAYIGSLVEG